VHPNTLLLSPSILQPSSSHTPFSLKNTVYQPRPFLRPALPTALSPLRRCQSSISCLTPSLYCVYSSLPSSSSSEQCPERRRWRLRFSQRQSGLKVQPAWGQRYGRSVWCVRSCLLRLLLSAQVKSQKRHLCGFLPSCRAEMWVWSCVCVVVV
jgi:hypothetical protein